MPLIRIRGKEYSYKEDEIINFAEGLIGFPEMRRAVVVAMDDFEPFYWLASLETEGGRFVLMEPGSVFADYTPPASGPADGPVRTFAIVKISSDWQKTTVNLRAPVVIDTENRSGSQLILSETDYQYEQVLVQE